MINSRRGISYFAAMDLRYFILGLLLGSVAVPINVSAQANLLAGKTVGVYISSKAVVYPTDYYIPIAQFVTRDNDAAWNGRLKAEFLIRMGWLLSEQLGALSEADTVLFLNADLPRGRAMQAAYDPVLNRISPGEEALDDVNFIIVLDHMDLDVRLHRSVFIRSNRMITERIPIKKVHCRLTLFDLASPDLVLPTEVCLDDMNDKNPPEWYFDFYRQESKLGQFLSKIYTQWWAQMLTGERSNCEER